MKLFLDINVVLDVLARREPWVTDSASVLSLVDTGSADGFVAAHTITTLHYLLSRHLGRERASAALVDLLDVVEVTPVDGDVIRKGLSLGWADFEDAIQAVCAMNAGVDYLVSRNTRDFAAISIPVATPAEILSRRAS